MIELFEQLLNQIQENSQDYKLVTDIRGEGNWEELSNEKIKLLEEIVKRVLIDDPIGRLVFRGQSFENEAELLNVELCGDIKEKIDQKLFPRLFNIGEKAKAFYHDIKSQRTFNITVEECEILFDDIAKKLKKNVCGIIQFCKDEKGFVTYFNDSNNKSTFVCKLMNNDKNIFAFYKCIEHILGSNDKSLNISTSEKVEIANKFSGKQYLNNGLIIGYVIPKEYNYENRKYPFSQRSDSLLTINGKIRKLELPSIGNWPFSGQKEVCVTGCLFPHLIWFIIDLRYKRIVINPHIFIEGLRKDSVFIDLNQSNFRKEIQLTKYSGYVTYYFDIGEFNSNFL